MDLCFHINHQSITFDNTKVEVVEKSKNYLYAKFEFSADWNNVTKTAIFVSAKGEAYNVLLLNDQCLIPWEVIEYPYFTVSVFGGDLITVNKTTVYVMKSGYCEGETPGEPTPDIYIQLLNAAKGPVIGENGNWYIWDNNKQLYVDSGVNAQGLRGDPGPKGDPFKYTDFTEEQLRSLTGPKGDKGDVGETGPKGDPFEYSDFTEEQLRSLTGPKGDKGDVGDPGPKGDPFKYTDFTEEQLRSLTGPKGDKGDVGETGSPGYSPVRGTDYWTDADKAEIKAYVDEAILGGEW